MARVDVGGRLAGVWRAGGFVPQNAPRAMNKAGLANKAERRKTGKGNETSQRRTLYKIPKLDLFLVSEKKKY